jgi:hypothetical protein
MWNRSYYFVLFYVVINGSDSHTDNPIIIISIEVQSYTFQEDILIGILFKDDERGTIAGFSSYGQNQ